MSLRETLAIAARDYLPSPRTRDSTNGVTYSGTRASRSKGRVGTSRPPRSELKRYRRLYETCALIRSPINQLASDVTADGVRFTAESDETQSELESIAENIALVGGESRHVIELIEQLSVTTDVAGESPTELVPASEDRDRIAALRVVPPESLTYVTKPGQAVLVDPEDTDLDDVVLTDEGTAAAAVQRKGSIDERGLDTDMFVRLVRDPNPGTVRGSSVIEPVADRADALKKKLEDAESAISSKAHGLWFAGAEPLIINGPDGDEVREPDADVTDGLPDAIAKSDPGDVITHDGQVGLDRLDGEVADLSDHLTHDVNEIVAAMPAPRYTLGAFDESINRRVTQEQRPIYESAVKQRKRRIEGVLSPVFAEIAEQRGYDPAGVAVSLEPPEDDSPVRSLSVEQSEVMLNVARSVKAVSGARDPTTLVEENSILDLVLQMPEEASVDGFADLEEQAPDEGEN
jgi:hypothetical protein